MILVGTGLVPAPAVVTALQRVVIGQKLRYEIDAVPR